MFALDELKKELLKIEKDQSECISESGYIINNLKYKYNNLIREASELKRAINYLEKLTENK